ncbi:hypothetical protein K490DRAFT_46795 [Saccharata proteae CBS 121410]|uniref:DUF4045 domain-containing protein n=1 Tax=Saccharata proteae CBS 121410 TaxID=1314787 RepID=A0A9P4HPA4_9PEZI|nr:hypothetical protein K490DRAFT_46795 [Saccharata proteae CBS 121410]
MEPTSQPGSPGDALKRLTGSPAEMPETENTSPTRQSASSLSRSGTLSWQQRRPASSSGRRPLSMFAQDSVTTRPLSSGRNDAPKAESDAVPRSQIAQSLGSKDPSWFRQTADRGEGSRAYRKDRDTEDTVSEAGSASTRKQLPGMSRDWTADMSESTPPGSAHSSSIRDSTAASARFSTNTSMSGFSNRDSKSPMPALDSQRFPAPGSSRPTSSHADEHTSPDRGLAMSSAQGRLAHDRSPSPTKGMGGFVQSAMMKRTESVNKRWSQQTPGRLSRQNSTASNASGLGGPLDIFNTPRLESTPRSPSREPSTDLHSRGKSLSALRARSSYSEDQTENGSPVSPSKRFSPTKSTWLESAINRPEAPSVKPRAPPPQPSWMAEIQKNKAQRASVDLSQRVGSMDLDNKASSPAWVSKADTIRGSITRGSTLASSADLKLDPPIPVASSSEAITDADAEKPPAPSSVDNTASSPSPKPATLPTPPAGMESVATTTTTESVVSPTIVPETQGPKTATEKTPSALKSTASPSLRSPTSPRGPLDASAKTDSPPKRDFRANLKSRQPPSDGGKKEELEFQNVFGKLRKAQQDKFVAPDVLKGNIVRGKDGLNKTDGPKPRERKDELRQSLIAQKEAIKAKTEEGGSPQRRKSSVSAASPTVPEALAKRRALGRNGSVSQASSPSSPVKDPPTPEAIARQKHLRERSKSSVSSPVQESPKDEVPEVPKPLMSAKLAERFNPALAGVLARGPSPMAGNSTANRQSGGFPSAPSTTAGADEPTAKAKDLTHMTKGRARGPKRRAPAAKKEAETGKKEAEAVANPPPVTAAPLVKPKDVLPSTEPTAENVVTPKPIRMSGNFSGSKGPKPPTPAKSPDLAKRLSSMSLSSPLASPKLENDEDATFATAGSSGPKPASAEPPKPSSPLPSPPAEEAKEEKTEPKPAFQPLPTPPAPESSKPEKVEAKPEASAPSVKNAASHWGRPTSPTMTRAKSPIKLPTRKDEAAANEEAGLNRPEPPPKGPIGLGLAGVAEAPKPTPIIRKPMERKPIEQPKLATKFPLSPPNSGGLPLKPERRPSRSSDPISPIPQSTEAGKLFADFFDEAPVTTGKLDVDTNAILNNNVLDQGEMKTTSHRIQEVTGDGKTLPMPEQEDYILYDESMYICTHGYETSNGSKTEVYYFWSGSAVPEPLVEDTLRSVRKTASDAKCKLITMKQGKELPGFFQALGGQLVIRKGSRTQHSNEYMLCVRHHLGNYAFDEVELSLSSLCSGFAYLVTSRTSLLAGKVYLWRGAGCNGDELGMARLVGASLGLTPGFTEIEQGREPADFLSVFPAPAHGPRRVPASSPHWNLKARADKNYAVRLFRVDEHKQAANGGFQVSSLWPSIMRRVSSQSLPSPTSSVPQTPVCDIAEIAPFDQTDLEAEHIRITDTSATSIVGALSRSQSHAFSTALLFAQEYGILSASAQDRPFVPDTKVVLEGVPTDMKFVFRRWTDAAMPTAALMAGRPRTANGLRVVPLSAAIAATRE